ncbi:MAG: N-6 DNA methylase [Tissierellia bacterium]|nr:N-6 DNA methylase [Fermentimonas sp.]MDD4439609.1 N-6 DNA methylase [Tissierellia bacterium]
MISQYIKSINERYNLGLSTEHTFRGDLQQLIENIVPNIQATNEPKRQKFGAPDYILTHKEVPVGYIEAKDLGDTDLDGKNKNVNKEQFDRYKASLPNIVFTDYLDFHFYRDALLIKSIKIGEITQRGIKPLPENFDEFEKTIKEFCSYSGQAIKSSKKLAQIMAGKARLLADVIKRVTSEEENNYDNALTAQMNAFKEYLIHDIDPGSFADIYSQTVVYGMFAARLNDSSLDNFSRQEAAELIPRTNPFLRKLFQHIAGPDIDDRIRWIVDDLALIFGSSDLNEILKDYGKSTRSEDPIIHFYETFLSEYDPKLRKSRGVWYTPQPVVEFIVRAVDDILKEEFNLPMGLADTAKTTVKVKDVIKATADRRSKVKDIIREEEVHRVQILDPATGTGTFLDEAVRLIHKNFEGQQGLWNEYVDKHLLPRLNGFELLMASYAMAHLKMSLVLKDTGYTGDSEKRLRIYLTNSLEQYHPDTGTLWANWLSNEANEANRVKRDTPVMVVIGNPPYSGESANKGKWIMNLMEEYKKEPGGKEKLKERNPKWINDDYVKFIRYGQHYIEKNESGILAYINPHGYLDNPTFRGMRWNLLKTFDKIYTIDLHGNTKKRETAPDGSKDENVFDIMQGVSINLFVKTGKKQKDELGKVFHHDLYGLRDFKYHFLSTYSLEEVDFEEVKNIAPNYFFINKDFEEQESYEKGFSVNELFPLNNVGIVTARDNFSIQKNKESVKSNIEMFLSLDDETARSKFKLGKDVRDWKVRFAKEDLRNNYLEKGQFTKISYRPFDIRWTFYTGNSKGFHCYPRKEVMQHFILGENIGLALCKQFKSGNSYVHSFISNKIIESSYVSNRTSEITSIFPLYIYSNNNNEPTFDNRPHRTPNLNKEIVSEFEEILKLQFVPEKTETNIGDELKEVFAPIDILDYVYAVLHSPTYREKYKEFLKIDFPRVPYPKDTETFWKLVNLGGEIRQVHLLESPTINTLIKNYPFMGEGDNVVEKFDYDAGKVHINDSQYYDAIPQIAWEFFIGGYQPAQKWLKDRKGRKLDYDDIIHYKKIVAALVETDRLMKEI